MQLHNQYSQKYAPKHPWLNKKLIFNHIAPAEKNDKSNATTPPPSSSDQYTNLDDNADSTTITLANIG